MATAQQVLTYRRLRSDVAAWRLLASDNAPFVLGALENHLLGGERRLPSSILIERLRQDLEQLRTQGLDLPQTPEGYLADWLRAGYLERSYVAGAGEEQYELSAPTIRAIQFAQSLGERRAVATESRLSMVLGQLRLLAEQTETDPTLRIEALKRERARLDAQIDAIENGQLETLPEDRALERTREILALANELGNDFRRVREEFQQLNRSLREEILESGNSRGEVLEKLFAGVDVIAEADAGRSFKAFWRLLTDPEQSVTLDTALEQVLSRDFSRQLSRQERQFLLQFTRVLLDRGGEVHDVFQHFARSLKQFVQSQEFREQRRLIKLLNLAQRRAVALKDGLKPTDDIGHTLFLTSAGIRSLSQWQLHDPSTESVDGSIDRAGEAEISLEAVGELVAHSEIDFRRLKAQILALLASRDQVSVGDVLAAFPAEQGLGSVVGLLALGVRHGIVTETAEVVSWQGNDSVTRGARIARVYFLKDSFTDD